MISALICMSLRRVWHPCNLPCVYAFFRLIDIARYVFKSPCVYFRGTKHEFYLLAFYIVTPGRLWLKLFASIVGRFLSRILYHLSLYVFLLRRRSFTSRKLYVYPETFFCSLQLSERAYVSRARYIGLFLLLVLLAPRDSNVAVYAQ